MFLKKLFGLNRDHRYYMEKGDRYFSDERYADARAAYGDALELLEREGERSLVESAGQRFAECGDILGRLNLAEAEHAIRGGDLKRGEDHLRIALDLAKDAEVRSKAEEMLSRLGDGVSDAFTNNNAHSCSDCKGEAGDESDISHETDGSMLGEDRLSLYFHTLPGDLPDRYAAMGAEFARGCLLNLEGDPKGAMKVFEELSAQKENDILDYEKAIIYYHGGDSRRCEELLKRGIELNGHNPLCYIGLVQLYTDGGRAGDAIPILKKMIAKEVIPDQATIMLGDVYALLGDDTRAVEHYTRLVQSSGLGREAAERLIPILEREGRTEEARFLIKKFAKRCG